MTNGMGLSGKPWRAAVRGVFQGVGALVLATSAPAAFAAPANDLFSQAAPIIGDTGTTSGDNIDATNEAGEPLHAARSNGTSVWYSWTPDTSTDISFDTFGSAFDTALAVYIGTDVTSLTEVASSDNFGLSAQSAVTFSASVGTTYFVAVSGADVDTGTIQLNWQPCSSSAPGTAANPVPADLESTTTLVTELDWDDVPGAREYEVSYDGLPLGRTAVSSISLGTSATAGMHTWQVVAVNACSSTTGPLWSFNDSCSAPIPAPVNPAPPSGTTVSVSLSGLDWDDVPGAIQYHVELDGSLLGTTTASAFSLAALALSPGEHTWQVGVETACGTTTGSLWSFNVCAPPAMPSDPLPADGVTTGCALASLDWADAPGALSYDVYLDSAFLGNTSTSDFALTAPLAAGTHQWEILAVGSCATTSGSLWSFCLAEGPAAPLPADGETTACGLLRLDWADACGATSYDVFLDSGYAGTVSASDFTLTAPLSGGSHKWQILAHTPCGDINGPVWNYCLAEAPSIPAPANGDTTGCALSVLDWDDACGATSYDVYLDGFAVATGLVGSAYTLGTSLSGGSHTWHVVAHGDCGSVAGTTWSFCLLDAPATPLVPAAGEELSTGATILDWADACGATTYTVRVDGAVVAVTTESQAELNPPVTEPGSHTWQVTAEGECSTSADGPVWQFSVACPLPEAATGPLPFDGMTTSCALNRLDWADAAGATGYRVLLDGTEVAVTSASEYHLPLPLLGNRHEWQVVSMNDCGETTGSLWNFCLLDIPTLVSPAEGETTDCAELLRFDWSDVCGASAYELYIDGTLSAFVTSSDYLLTASLTAGRHEWQVKALGSGCGESWSLMGTFCLQSAPAQPSPLAGETTACSLSRLDWAETCGAATYDVYLDSTLVGTTTESEILLDAPLASGAHSWYVVASGCGVTTSPVWTFCLLKAPAGAVSPGDGEQLSTSPALLDWSDACGATTYTVTLDGVVIGETTDSQLLLSEPLPATGGHSWKVTAAGECAALDSATWTFSVACPPPAMASNPLPLSGDTTGCDLGLLDWADGAGATEYKVLLDGVQVAVTSSSEYLIPVSPAAGSHNWQIVSVSACGAETRGPVWTFCVLNTPELLTPAASETTGCAALQFDWSDTCGAGKYELYLDGVLQGAVAASDYLLTATLAPGSHNWQVKAIGSDCGESWSITQGFCVQGTPAEPLPADGETTGCSLPQLDWADACGATSYDLYIDGLLVAPGLTSSESTVPASLVGGAHTWQVVASGGCGLTTGPLWAFCLLDAPSGPTVPENGELLALPLSELDWADTCGATTYSVVLDGTVVAVTTQSRVTLSAPVSEPGGHTWQVIAEGECSTTVDGPLWRFSIACPQPETAVNPLPADGVTTACSLERLDWDDAADATGYRVLVDGIEVGVTSSSEYQLSASLAAGPHNWQIISLNDCEETTGALWNFCLLDSARLVSPAAVETTDCVAAVYFDWTQACGANVYELYVDGTLQATTAASDYLLTASLSTGRHEWQIKAFGELCGESWSAVGEFCVQGQPAAPSPAAGETTGCALARLDWSDACGATSYDVYVDSNLVGTTTESELLLGAPLSSGSHTWYVLATGCGVTSSPVWNFCLLDAPSSPTPAHNDVVPGPVDTFDWSDACGATTYTLVVDGVVTATTNVSRYTLPSGALSDGEHTWQVAAQGECSVTTGPLWRFVAGCGTTPPPSNPFPPDGSTTGTALSRLTWNAVPDTPDYKVFIDGNFVGTVTSTEMIVNLGTGTYTWQVIANTMDCGEVEGPVWTFTVCDVAGMPVLITPPDGVTTSPDNLFFDWTDSENTRGYLLVVDNTTWGTLPDSDFRMPFSLTSGLHKWKVVAQSGCNFTTSTEFMFCGLRAPGNPRPADTSTFCVPPEALDWDDVESATGYDVYFDGQLVSQDQRESRYPLPGSLPEGRHTWRVVVRNECGEQSSPEWSLNVVAEAGARRYLWSTNGSVYAMAVAGDIVFIGGSFSQVGTADSFITVPRANLAAIDVKTGRAIDWNPGTDAPIRALTVDSGVLYVGGEFDRVAGQIRSQIAAIDMTSGGLLSWNPGANGPVHALAVDANNVYAGGRFTQFGGANRRYAAAVSRSSGAVLPWNPNPNAFVRTLAVAGSNVYLGGNFSTLGGQSRTGLGAVDTAAGSLLPWSAGVDLYVYSIVPDGSRMYVGGLFNNVGGQPRRNLACIDMATGQPLPWAPETNGAVNAIALSGNSVYVGGLFSQIGGRSRPYLSAVESSTGLTPDCGFDPDYPIHCLAVSGETVCVGGDFTYIGTSSKRGFAGFGGVDEPPTRVNSWEKY